jgi:hypothetical protein
VLVALLLGTTAIAANRGVELRLGPDYRRHGSMPSRGAGAHRRRQLSGQHARRGSDRRWLGRADHLEEMFTPGWTTTTTEIHGGRGLSDQTPRRDTPGGPRHWRPGGSMLVAEIHSGRFHARGRRRLGGDRTSVEGSESHRPRLFGRLPTSYPQPPGSQIQMQTNNTPMVAPTTPVTPTVAPATPAVAPATPVTPTAPITPAAPVATALVAILAKPEDSRDPHVCPFSFRETSSAQTPKALAAIEIGGRSALSGQRNPATTSPPSPTAADVALAVPATAPSPDPPTLGWLATAAWLPPAGPVTVAGHRVLLVRD